MTTKLLQLRKLYKQLFPEGAYIPVYTEGRDRIIIAYLRHFENTWILEVLPVGIVTDAEKNLRLILPEHAPVKWKDIFNSNIYEGASLEIKKLLSGFPVSVLINQ